MTAALILLALLAAPQGERHAAVGAEFAASQAVSGGEIELRLPFRVDAGWHIYHPADDSGMGQPPSVRIATVGFAASGPLTTEAEPIRRSGTLGGNPYVEQWLEGEPVLRLPVSVTAAPGRHVVEVEVSWMECNERTCLPPTKAVLPVALEVLPAAGQAAAAPAGPPDALSGRVKITHDFPAALEAGRKYPLRFRLEVEAGWHVYHPDQDADWGEPVRVEIEGEGFRLSRPATTAAEPIHHREEFGDLEVEYLWLEGALDFEAEIEVTGDPAVSGARVFIRWQTCDESVCLDPEHVSFLIGGGAPIAAGGTTAAGLPGAKPGLADQGFLLFLAAAVLAGLFTLLTPCVFPMIPVTISYFTKRADDGKGTPLGNATAYAGGIVLTFSGIGVGAALLLGPMGANAIGANPWVNLGIGLLFVWMALSLLGFYEIQAPRFLQNFASRTQSEGRQKAGYLPVLLMAVAFSITAFTCTVGFVGALFAAGLNLGIGYLVGGMLVYGAVFALPFFFLALFPSWLKSMPSAGGWMNVVKVSAGFVELIAAIKFFSNTDLRFEAQVLTWYVAIALTMVFLLLWAGYMFGLYRTHHDYERAKPGKGRIAVGVFALAAAGFLSLGLFERSEKAYPGGWSEAYLPPFDYGAEKYAADGGVIKAGGLSWQTSYLRAWELAVEQDQPLFLDFTGVTCVNCRKMEYDIFPHPDVHPLLARLARAELWVDKPPFGGWNSTLEVERFQAAAQPYYAVLDPRDDAVLAVKDGYDPDPSEFVAFLSGALELYAARTPGPMPVEGPWHERHPFPADAESYHLPWAVSQSLIGGVLLLVAWLAAALLRQEARKRREEAELAAA